MNKIVFAAIGTALTALTAGTEDMPSLKLDAGPLKLEIYVSRTANLFHVVDQLSQWNEFCHQQYVRYFKSLPQGLSSQDQAMLEKHKAVRTKHGWGDLDQVFYTTRDLPDAIKTGVQNKYLTSDESRTEEEVLTWFAPRIDKFMQDNQKVLDDFQQQLKREQTNLVAFAEQVSHFAENTRATVPVYLIVSPPGRSGGGGYNGGKLTVEISSANNPYSTLLHESFHAFIKPHEASLKKAVRQVKGLDEQTLNEGLTYAMSNILAVKAGEPDRGLEKIADDIAQKKSIRDSYTRFSRYGLALRPVLQDALDNGQTLSTFLPRAVDVWLAVAELSKAMEGEQGK